MRHCAWCVSIIDTAIICVSIKGVKVVPQKTIVAINYCSTAPKVVKVDDCRWLLTRSCLEDGFFHQLGLSTFGTRAWCYDWHLQNMVNVNIMRSSKQASQMQ